MVRTRRVLPWEGWLAIAVALVVLMLAVTAEGLWKPPVAFSFSRTFALLGMIAVGQSLVVAAGGVDLSVGSIYGFTGVLLAILTHLGYGFGVTLPAGVGAGSFIGLVNGLLVTKLRLMPFIATFAMLAILRAANFLLLEGTVGLGAIAVRGTAWTYLARGQSPLWLPPVFFILIGLAVGAWLLLKYTRFGLWAYGTGGNLNAARAVGVPVDKVRILTYVISGALAAVAGMMNAGSVQAARPFFGAGMELTSLAAVIIGGASLAGGSASILGTMLTVVLFSVIKLGIAQMGLAIHYQYVITGLTVLVALVLTRLSLGRGTKKRGLLT